MRLTAQGMQGVDTLSQGIAQTQNLIEEAQQPGPPAPYSRQRLTVLDSGTGGPGPKAKEGDQVPASLSVCVCLVGKEGRVEKGLL